MTYHHPIPDAPVAYATFFRLRDVLRANIFSPGVVSNEWQRDLKQQPLDVLGTNNRLLSEAAKAWKVSSHVTIRKVQVTQLNPPTAPRVLVLGDAAHTIDPTGGGGLTFSLLEVELLLAFFLPRWLKEGNINSAAIQSFYTDHRRVRAVRRFFGRGQYIYALNHNSSLQGRLRRLRFALNHNVTSRLRSRPVRSNVQYGVPWQLPAPYLYEQF